MLKHVGEFNPNSPPTARADNFSFQKGKAVPNTQQQKISRVISTGSIISKRDVFWDWIWLPKSGSFLPDKMGKISLRLDPYLIDLTSWNIHATILLSFKQHMYACAPVYSEYFCHCVRGIYVSPSTCALAPSTSFFICTEATRTHCQRSRSQKSWSYVTMNESSCPPEPASTLQQATSWLEQFRIVIHSGPPSSPALFQTSPPCNRPLHRPPLLPFPRSMFHCSLAWEHIA